MNRKLLGWGLLIFLVASPCIHAQNPVDPAAIQALKDMGTALQSLQRFEVSTELTGERVLADGQKLQHGASAKLDIARPSRLRVRMSSSRSERELIYDGKVVTLYTPALKSYSTVEFPGSLHDLIRKLEEGYGVELPLSDLFLWGTPQAPLDQMESAMNAGQDIVNDALCDHYAFRQANLDWQIWISAEGKPLPRKLVITNRADEARPQSVSLITWNLKPAFSDSEFAFKPPADAKAAKIVPRKTK